MLDEDVLIGRMNPGAVMREPDAEDRRTKLLDERMCGAGGRRTGLEDRRSAERPLEDRGAFFCEPMIGRRPDRLDDGVLYHDFDVVQAHLLQMGLNQLDSPRGGLIGHKTQVEFRKGSTQIN